MENTQLHKASVDILCDRIASSRTDDGRLGGGSAVMVMVAGVGSTFVKQDSDVYVISFKQALLHAFACSSDLMALAISGDQVLPKPEHNDLFHVTGRRFLEIINNNKQ